MSILPQFSIGQQVIIGSSALLCFHGKVLEVKSDYVVASIGIKGANIPLHFKDYKKTWRLVKDSK